MMTFWIIAALALVIALWFIVPALLGERLAGPVTGAVDDDAIRQRIASLEADVERGLVARDEADRVRRELEASLWRDAASGGEAGRLAGQPRSRRRVMTSPAVVAVGLPLAAVGLYLQLGGGPKAVETTPTVPVESTAGRMNDPTAVASPPHTTGTSNLSVEEAAARLAARLQQQPNDPDGWQLLSSSYEYLGRTKEAAEAAARAAALRGAAGGGAATIGTASAGKVGEGQGIASKELIDIVSVGGPASGIVASPGDPSLADLEAAAEAKPDDKASWIALGHAYQSMKRYTSSADAYAKAVKLDGNDAALLADYGDVLAAANGGWLPGEPMTWVDKALAIDPAQTKALWLAATAATQQQDRAKAVALWERLQALLPAGSEDAAAVAANLAEARGAEPMADAATKPTASTQAGGGTVIRGTVKLDPQLAASVAADDTVFIFARAAEGPRMPLAVVRKQARDLPASFVLDDSMAMAPSMRLSDFPRVIVGARISKSGNAMPQPGDLEGTSETIDAGSAEPIDIVIDRKNS